ncbi:MAG: hypothetical protein DI533_12125 [Cereibacter sphaeroides]|uniref:DNA methyltransferase n=1 Tax=Cereibacter sphaeroides TaxID=1063 RepID=A0A2W5TQ20_CERSP|nr:MAG: hypothetical protein DI533_12125 [Cereibacter sphaeroides]
MEQLLIQLVAGAIGGNAAGKAMPSANLGTLGNTIAGLVGGGILGQIVQALFTSGAVDAAATAVAGGGMDIGSIIANLASGGVGGAVLTAIVGMIKNRAA